MAFAIEWDKTGERFYENNVRRGVLYPQNVTPTEANGGYGDGVAWNGLTGVTESPTGAEPTNLWADGIKYGVLRSAESFEGSIEAYTYPKEFEQCDGSAEIAKGVFAGQQARVPFGFSYVTDIGNDTESESDNGYKIHLVYGATVNPSERAHATINDSPDAMTMSWDFTTNPIALADHRAIAHLVIDTRYADPAKVTAFENILYGSGNTAPRLPLPSEMATMFPVGP